MRHVGVGIVVVLLVAACGSAAPSGDAPSGEPAPLAPNLDAGRLATVADLLGPWQREPFAVDANVRAAADRACRADPEFPAGVQLVGIDARGNGRLFTIYAGPGGQSAECAYLEVDPDGSVAGSLSGTGGGGLDQVAPGQLASQGGGAFSTDGPLAVQYVVGRVGAGVARVGLQVEGVGPVTASLGNGWYIAWWEIPTAPRQGGLVGPHFDMKSFTVTAYDGMGQVTDQSRE